jgi:CRISPR-associated protein Cas2
MRQVYVICYDITENKIRRKIDILLSSYGERIQYSVFEIVISEDKLKGLRQEINKLIEVTTDKINYFRLCQWCRSSTQIQGNAELSETKGHVCV